MRADVCVMRGPLVYCLEGGGQRRVFAPRYPVMDPGGGLEHWLGGNGWGQALSCTDWRRRCDPAAPLYAPPLQDDLEPASLKWIPYGLHYCSGNRNDCLGAGTVSAA